MQKKLKYLLNKKDFYFLAKLLKKFPKSEIFLVGGIIRDTIIGRQSKDYDFVVRNVPAKQLQSFLSKLGWVGLVGKNFGVLKFMPKGSKLTEAIDIALPRTEHAYLTGGYRDFDIQSNPKLPIEDDLKRRDFTINALAFDIKNNKVIDLFDGLKDIQKKKIKTVGQAEIRFREDYSRTLRALRFSCQLNFDIDKNTYSALKKILPAINTKTMGTFRTPREVIAKEMVKAFYANPAKAFETFDKSGATKLLMPELLTMKKCPQPRNFHSEGDVWKHTLLTLQNLKNKKFQKKFGLENISQELVIAALFHDLGKPYTIKRADRLRFNNHDAVGADKTSVIMDRLKLSNSGLNTEHVYWLIKRHMIATHTKKSPMKKTTLEKYFFNDQVPGDDLLKLTYADIMATIPPTGRPIFTQYHALEKQVNELKRLTKNKKVLPREIINGHEIIKKFKIKSGPKIGKLKLKLREEQLKGRIKTKQQAYNFLKKHAGV